MRWGGARRRPYKSPAMTTTSLLRLGALALAFAAGSVFVAWGGGIENQKSKIENDARPPGMALIPAGTYVPLQRATNEAASVAVPAFLLDAEPGLP